MNSRRPKPLLAESAAGLLDKFHARYPALRAEFVMTEEFPDLGRGQVDLAILQGDRAGPYREVEFKYETSAAAARLGAIRIYDYRPVVIFKLVFLTAGSTSESFPTISSYPRNLHHLTYTATFGGFSFERFGPDGPWVFFDDQANTFIFSPASHYMNAALSLGPQNELVSGISADVDDTPPGFAAMSALVIAPGINRAFEMWGRANEKAGCLVRLPRCRAVPGACKSSSDRTLLDLRCCLNVDRRTNVRVD